MSYWSLCLLLCCHFVDKTFGHSADSRTISAFSDSSIIPYTIATYGKVVYKIDGRCFLKDIRRNVAPEGEPLEYFKTFLKTSKIYVDKSSFVTEVLNDKNRVIRILRPSGWGKTLNLNMLEKFLEIEVNDKGDQIAPELKTNRELFCGQGSKRLEICNSKPSMDSFGKYPVISISLKGIRGNGYKEIELGIRDRIMTAFRKHRYLERYLDKNETLIPAGPVKDRLLTLMDGECHTIDMLCSIRFLSDLLYNHHFNSTRVYLLIDDFDSPVINAYSDFGHNRTEFEELLNFMREFFSIGIKGNEFIEKVVITGTYHLDDEFVRLANITEYNLLNDGEYATHFGFTEKEVEDVLRKSSLSTPISQVNQWYGGYAIEGKTFVYNPGSVMEFISNQGKLDQYTVRKVNESIVGKILSSDETKIALKKALGEELVVEGHETDMEIDPAKNDIGKSIVLLCNGIFTSALVDLDKRILRLKLPNEEVKQFVKKVLE